MKYLLLSILVFAGIYLGVVVGKIAQEELKPGREYLKWLMHGLFVAIIGYFFYANVSRIFFLGIPALLILFSMSRDRETLYYYALALIMILSYTYNGFTVIAPLIFLYGFPIGSLYLLDNAKLKTKQFWSDLSYRYAGFILLNLAFAVLIAVS